MISWVRLQPPEKAESQPFAFPQLCEIRQLLAHALGTPISSIHPYVYTDSESGWRFWVVLPLFLHFWLLSLSLLVGLVRDFYLLCCTTILYWQKDVWLGDFLLALSPQQQHPPKKWGLSLEWLEFCFPFLFFFCFFTVCVHWLRFYSLFPQWLVHFKFIDFRTLQKGLSLKTSDQCHSFN